MDARHLIQVLQKKRGTSNLCPFFLNDSLISSSEYPDAETDKAHNSCDLNPWCEWIPLIRESLNCQSYSGQRY